MKRLIFSLLVLFTPFFLPQSVNYIPDSPLLKDSSFHQFYSLENKTFQDFPVNRINNITAFYPGVVSYYNNFHIRGGRNNETGFFIDGFKFNDLFSGNNSFLISPKALEEIEYTPGFITTDYGNTTSGLFNYILKTGGEKFQMNVEQLTDNITFTNDPYSGKKRLGAYYYGYNEFNINAGGPLYFSNLKYFVNANYLFQRDKNPQRYPGINETFADPSSEDTIIINLPAGIVPNNYSETFNLVSTFVVNTGGIKINASAVYFSENEYAGRNHILNYLSKNSLVKKDGGLFNIKLEDKINDLISFSINGNYYFKNEKTSDPYLGENYWAYGDSVANAEAGIYWERDISGYSGRYMLPRYVHVYGNIFTNKFSPITNYDKSEQNNFSLKGIIIFGFGAHYLRAGGEITESTLRHWSAPGRLWGVSGQASFAARLAFYPGLEFIDETEKQKKANILKSQNVNNFGYNLLGDKTDTGLYEPPKPAISSLFIDDRLSLFENVDIYLGLRYDHYSYNYKTPVNPERPEETYSRLGSDINELGLKPTKSYSYLSPKIYLHHNVLNNLSYFINYSRNVQHQAFSDLFEGFASLNYGFTADFGLPFIFKTALLQPVVSSIFETGLNYYLPGGVKVQLNIYKKLIKNQPSIELQKTSVSSIYNAYYYAGSNGSTDIKGFEVILDYNFKGIQILSSLSFEDGRENYYYVNRDELNPVTADIPLINSNKINFKSFLKYDFGQVNKESDILNNMNLSLLFLYNSGHPYIKTGVYNGLYAGTDVTPSVFQVDLKLEKDFSLFNNLNLGLYLYVINLLDTKNIYDVFASTGSAEEDNITRQKELYFPSSLPDADKIYRLYRLINIDYNPNNGQQTMYGPPRQIGIGAKLKL